MKPQSLTTRLTLLVALVATLAMAVAALSMDQMVDRQLEQRFDASLLLQAQSLAAMVESSHGSLYLEEGETRAQHMLSPGRRQTFLAQCNDGGRLAYRLDAAVLPANWRGGGTGTRYFDLGSGRQARRAVRIGFNPFDESGPESANAAPPCLFVLAQPTEPLEDIMLSIDAILLLAPMVVLILVLALTPVLVRRGTRPLSALREGMAGIGPQSPGRRLPTSRVRELQPLVERFNEVLERMDQGVMRERRFAGAVAHETRTHLAELRSLLDVESRHPSRRPTHAVLAEISDIAGEMESTVSALLMLTRLEAGMEPLVTTAVDPVRLVDNQLELLAGAIRERALHLVEAIQREGIQLETDRDLLKLIIHNMVANAVGHAPRGDTVELRLDARGMTVRNHAPGLEPEDIPRLGQRHWSKRQSDGAHVGLGLSLAGAAAGALGLTLAFELDAERHLIASLDWSGARLDGLEPVHEADGEAAG